MANNESTEYKSFINRFNELIEREKEKLKHATDEYTISDELIFENRTSLEGHGINLDDYWEEYLDFIIKNLPSTVKKLNTDRYILSGEKGLLSRIPQIETLNILGSDMLILLGAKKYSYQELMNSLEGSNVKEVTLPYLLDDEFYHLDDSMVLTSLKGKVIKTKDLKVTAASSMFAVPNQHVYLNNHTLTEEDVEDISNFFDKESALYIFKNGKRVFSVDRHTKGENEKETTLTTVLTEPIEEYIKDMKSLSGIYNESVSNIDINVDNITYKDITKLKELEHIAKVTIQYGFTDTCTIDEFIGMRATIDYFKSLIEENDLSPAEQICYAYDLIKSYIYQEAEEDKKNESRKIHSIIDTGKIVCIGYARLFSEILKELGITSYTLTTDKHGRTIVDIKDDKYGINGSYAFDCTWDSNRTLYKVISGTKKKISYRPKEQEQVVHTYDNMSSYRHFFVPLDEYEDYFDIPIDNRRGLEIVSPKEKKTEELTPIGMRKNNSREVSDTALINAEAVSEEKILSIIYNTRIYEGYNKDFNDSLIQEVSELRTTYQETIKNYRNQRSKAM